MAAQNPHGAHFRAMADVSASAFTRHGVFSEDWTLPRDAQPAPAGQISSASPAHPPPKHIPGGNPDCPGLAATNNGASANQSISELPSITPLYAGAGDSSLQIQSQASESAPNAPAGGNPGPNTSCAADTAASTPIRSSTANHMAGVRTPHHFIPSIQGAVQGMVQGTANLAGLFAGLLPASGQTRANLQVSHTTSTQSVGAYSAETPKDGQNQSPNAAKSAGCSSTRARKAAQLIVARAENPPPE
jgi:hypothetical protein